LMGAMLFDGLTAKGLRPTIADWSEGMDTGKPHKPRRCFGFGETTDQIVNKNIMHFNSISISLSIPTSNFGSTPTPSSSQDSTRHANYEHRQRLEFAQDWWDLVRMMFFMKSLIQSTRYRYTFHSQRSRHDSAPFRRFLVVEDGQGLTTPWLQHKGHFDFWSIDRG